MAAEEELPAWSLPAEAVDRIALPARWPERVTREWAWGESTGACACCSAKAFADSKGTLYLLYRAATGKVDRDIYLLTSKGGAPPFRAHYDLHRAK